MKKVTYFDVEYANKTNKSICQMGIICENWTTGDSFYPDKDIFLNPEDLFEDACTAAHGINAKRVRSAPTFPQAWEGLEKYFTSAVIVGYDAADDLDALTFALNRYHLDVPALYYIDTLELAKQVIRAGEVSDWSLTGLCKHFGIKMLTEHYAYDDALGNAALLKKLVKTYNIQLENVVKKFEPAEDRLLVSISRFYGMVQGFGTDNAVTARERRYINKWYDDHQQYADNKYVAAVLAELDEVMGDGVITLAEMKRLEKALKYTLDSMSTSAVTASTHVLEGIMEGIIADGRVNLEECRMLRQWLIDNIGLTGNYAFDKLMELTSEALADGVVSDQESDHIIAAIQQLL